MMADATQEHDIGRRRRIPSPKDLVYLNVCGELMTVTRETLIQVPGSLLALMFSEHSKDAPLLDHSGRHFLNFDPVDFRAVLRHLTCRLLDKEEADALWNMKLMKNRELAMLWSHLGLLSPEHFIFRSGCPRIQLSHGQTRAEVEGDHWAYVLGEPPMVRGKVYMWRVNIERVGDRAVYLGVIGMLYPDSASYLSPSSNTWAGPGAAYISGELTGRAMDVFRTGDNPIFKLDLTQPQGVVLSMYLPRTQQLYSMPCHGPHIRQWYVHACLNSKAVVWVKELTNNDKRAFRMATYGKRD